MEISTLPLRSIPASDKVSGENNQIAYADSIILPRNLMIKGNNNRISLEKGTDLSGVDVSITGDDNIIILGKNCRVRGGFIIHGNQTKIIIGDSLSTVGCWFRAREGTCLSVGNDCMFSRGIEIRTTDEHPIYDRATRERINSGRDIFIGNHVWIAQDVTILKGSKIASGSVVGAGSIVTGSLDTENSIYAGTPARLKRENIYWARTTRPVDWDEIG